MGLFIYCYYFCSSPGRTPDRNITPGAVFFKLHVIYFCRIFIIGNSISHLVIFETPAFEMPLIQRHREIPAFHPDNRGYPGTRARMNRRPVRVTESRTLGPVFQVSPDVIIRGGIHQKHTDPVRQSRRRGAGVHHDIFELDQKTVPCRKRVIRQVKSPHLFFPGREL